MIVDIRGQSFDLSGARTALWRDRATLIAADLHWGKVEAFAQHGIPLPGNVFQNDLRRLGEEITRTGAERLFLLGDLVHSARSVTESVSETVATWRSAFAELEIILIRGNHDRAFEPPEPWRISVHDEAIQEDHFAFTHDELDESEAGGRYVWAGHIHPVITLRGGGDRLRLPCFVLDTDRAWLPAFSEFTGGLEVNRGRARKLFVVADSQVVPV